MPADKDCIIHRRQVRELDRQFLPQVPVEIPMPQGRDRGVKIRGKQGHRPELFRMIGRYVNTLEPSAGHARKGAVRFIGKGPEQAVRQGHHLVHKMALRLAVQRPERPGGIDGMALLVILVAKIIIQIGQDQDKLRGFTHRYQRIQAGKDLASLLPGKFVPARPVQQIQDRIAAQAVRRYTTIRRRERFFSAVGYSTASIRPRKPSIARIRSESGPVAYRAEEQDASKTSSKRGTIERIGY